MCRVGGNKKSDISIEDIREGLRKSSVIPKEEPKFSDISHPEFKDVTEHSFALQWLLANNCEDALKRDSSRFKFDIRRNRVVFVNYDGPFYDVCIGRSLDGTKPKWYKYDSLNGYFVMSIAGPENLFIVEDCASACSVARIGIGLALCGTSYDTGILFSRIRRINGLRNVYVCLDRDARKTSLDLKKDLQGLISLKVRTIDFSDDAKNLSLEQLKKEIA